MKKFIISTILLLSTISFSTMAETNQCQETNTVITQTLNIKQGEIDFLKKYLEIKYLEIELLEAEKSLLEAEVELSKYKESFIFAVFFFFFALMVGAFISFFIAKQCNKPNNNT